MKRGYKLALEFFHHHFVLVVPLVAGLFREEGRKSDVGWRAKDISAICKPCRKGVVKQMRYVNARMLL